MKKYLVSVLIMLFSMAGSAHKSKGFTIEYLTGDFYIYTTWGDVGGAPFPANGMYIVTAKGIVIIDSPWDTAQAIPFLDSIQRRHHSTVIAAIATHFHTDRTGAFDIFRKRNIKTYSTCQTLAICKEKHEAQAQYCFSTDTTFDFGDHKVQAFYPGEGHSHDNIVIWCEKEKILYGGCLVKSTETESIGNLSDANLKEWGNTIQKLKTQFPSPAFIIPGHQSWKSLKALDHTTKLVEQASLK